MHMLSNAGVPVRVLKFWMSSLNNLSRLPQLGQSLGGHVFSTTGVPEGDSLSVCGMIALAYHFQQHLALHFNQIVVSVYADNWSWISHVIKQNFGALLQTMAFTSAIRMQIDFDKSWAYAIGKDFKQSLSDLELIFPDGRTTIHIVDDAKELGVQVKYSKRVRLGPITNKLEDAIKKIYKISWMQTDIRSKSFLTRAVWQKVFYGIEGQAIGESHFNRLRRAAANLLIGPHRQASPWISCHFLQQHMMDPQLFVLVEVVCLIRQLAFHEPQLANSIVETASSYDGHPPKQSWGPGTTLAAYCKRVGLVIHPNGEVGGPEFTRCNILSDSCKMIKKFLINHWGSKVYQEIEHRKGVPKDRLFNRDIVFQVLRKFENSDQRGIFLNIAGGFQSGALKSMLYENQSENCPYCGEVDTKTHRLIDCKQFADIREKHDGAVKILKENHPEWIHLPLPIKHQDCSFFNLVMSTKVNPIPYDLFNDEYPQNERLAIFTDGTCCESKNILARRAGFSVVVDYSSSQTERYKLLEKFIQDGQIPECFRVHTTSHVVGSQDPARAELSAIVHVVKCHKHFGRNTREIVIYTDSAYVIKIIHNLDFYRTSPVFKEYHSQNFELVEFLMDNWDDRIHKIEKVKAHENIQISEGLDQAWKKLGNFVADEAAKSSLKIEVAEIITLSNQIATHDKSQKCKLEKVFRYLADYNKQSMWEAQQIASKTNPVGKVIRNKKESYKEIASTWRIKVPLFIDFPGLTPEVAQCCSWGMEAAYDVYKWLSTLVWPLDPNPQQGDCGITFLEMFVNFRFVTGKNLPITLHRKGTRVTWASFNSDSCLNSQTQSTSLLQKRPALKH